MFYRDYQKKEMLRLFERILPEQEWKRLSDTAEEIELEEMKQIAKTHIERIISTRLLELGIPPHMLGYYYLRAIISDAVESPDVLQDISHNCYTKIAAVFQKSPLSVERAIRLAITNAWENKGDICQLTKTPYRPTNREFISFVAEQIRVRYF